MVSRWHLLHLPVTLYGKAGHWGWVEDIVIRWPEGVIDGFGVRTAISRFYIPAEPEVVSVTLMEIQLRRRSYALKRPRSWWKTLHAQKLVMNRPVWRDNGDLVGRIKDLIIDENSLAVHQIVISRGLLEDLLHGALLVPTHEIREDADGKIKIFSNRAI